MNFKTLWIAICILTTNFAYPQSSGRQWNGKKCAVALTYDDALNVHLDKVIPMLDAFHFRGTFYLIASAPAVANRIEEWRMAAKEGHELGNHTLVHPCDGNLPGRGFVTSDNDLSKYTLERAIAEIKVTNVLLQAIDGKTERTFAYPCGDLTIGGIPFFNYLKNDFVAARGVEAQFRPLKDIDLYNMDAFGQNKSSGEDMIAQVKAAEKAGSLIVFLFHGVGGEHGLNVEAQEHLKLLEYLKTREDDVWVAPLVEVAKYIKQEQQKQ
jgi:peptidoglycan/xylan/chitin deacetylase (PgdA/CDA1 family)